MPWAISFLSPPEVATVIGALSRGAVAVMPWVCLMPVISAGVNESVVRTTKSIGRWVSISEVIDSRAEVMPVTNSTSTVTPISRDVAVAAVRSGFRIEFAAASSVVGPSREINMPTRWMSGGNTTAPSMSTPTRHTMPAPIPRKIAASPPVPRADSTRPATPAPARRLPRMIRARGTVPWVVASMGCSAVIGRTWVAFRAAP